MKRGTKRLFACMLIVLLSFGTALTTFAQTESLLNNDDGMIVEAAEAVEESVENISAKAGCEDISAEEKTTVKDGQLLGLGGAGIRISNNYGTIVYEDKVYYLPQTGDYQIQIYGIDLTQDLEAHTGDASVAEAFFNEGIKKQRGSYACLNLYAYKEGKTVIAVAPKGKSDSILSFVINVPKRDSLLVTHNHQAIKNGSSITISSNYEKHIAFNNLQMEDALFEYSENTFSGEPSVGQNGDGELLMSFNGNEGGSVHVKVCSKSEPSLQMHFTVHRTATSIETDSATGITHAIPGVAFYNPIKRLQGALSIAAYIPDELRTGGYKVYAEYRFRDKDQKVLKTVKDVWEVPKESSSYECLLTDAFEDQNANDVEACIVLVNKEADVTKINESWYSKKIQQRGKIPAGKYSADAPVEFQYSIEKDNWVLALGKEATISAVFVKDAKDVSDLSCHWELNPGEILAQIVKGAEENTLTIRANEKIEGRLSINAYVAWVEHGEKKWFNQTIMQTIGSEYSNGMGILCDGITVNPNGGALTRKAGSKSTLEAVEGHYDPIGFDSLTNIEWKSSNSDVAEVTRDVNNPEKATVAFKMVGMATITAIGYRDEQSVVSLGFTVSVESSGGGSSGGGGSLGGGGGASGGPKAVAKAGATTFSKNWVADAAGVWRIKDKAGNFVTSAWLCDDAVTANGQNVWYLMNTDGTMLAAGLVQDNTGNYYSLEMNHNGYYGMLRYTNGTYDGIYMEFSQKHDGTFGAITNQAAIDALKAKYGVTKFAIGNDRCVYSKTFE